LFGMANGDASVQQMFIEMFKDMIDLGIDAYTDDILIYSQTTEEPERLIKEALSCLEK
jgi:hypothetical protein